MKDTSLRELTAAELRWRCDPAQFRFECTQDLAPLKEFIGQERAKRAIEFGLSMPQPGYNIYVAGLSGTGKTAMTQDYIERIIREKEAAGEKFSVSDWCYIYNFKEPDKPRLVALPPGQGKKLRAELEDLLKRLKDELGRAFNSNEYKNERQKAVAEGEQAERVIFEQATNMARQQGFTLQMTPMGPALMPLVAGRPMEEAEYAALGAEEKTRLEEVQTKLRTMLQAILEKASGLHEQHVAKLESLDRRVADLTVSRLLAPLLKEYADVPKLAGYLAELKDYTLNNLAGFKTSEKEAANPALGMSLGQLIAQGNPFLPFQVNVFIDNSETRRPPVIVENNPNFANMFGKIERRFILGGYISDHTMLKPGALSLADGGYLLVSAQDVILNPGVWPALKRVLKSGELRVEDPFEQLGLMVAPQGMKPEPMPVRTKVVLIDDEMIYYLLAAGDEDFKELFRVKADFDPDIRRDRIDLKQYAAFVAGCCEACQLQPVDPTGVARLIEHAARLVGDQEHLSTRFSQLKELVQEAGYWAAREGVKYIGAAQVDRAVSEKEFRLNLIDERIREMTARGQLMIAVDGEEVGQVNAVSVYTLGDAMFGRPLRVIARTFMGRGGVINIERESKLSGPTYDKGVLILSGYLASKFAQDKPLSVSVTLGFEQSYSGIEGDSATSAELYAVLSSLAEVPVRQYICATGSANQRGELQAVGGINEKIEGWYAACKDRGLTGKQGVLIPHQNEVNLMLHPEVVEAVQAGQFHVWSAAIVDEGIELLTGLEAGEKRADGTYPPGSVNQRIDQRLREMNEKIKAYLIEPSHDGGAATRRELAASGRASPIAYTDDYQPIPD